MENEEKKKMKYVSPCIETMAFGPGDLLAGSIGASSGGWSIDDGISGTGASTGGWSIDGANVGASSGGWSIDNSGSGSSGASTGGWSKD